MSVLDQKVVSLELVGDRNASDSPKVLQTSSKDKLATPYRTRKTRKAREDYKETPASEDEEDKENTNKENTNKDQDTESSGDQREDEGAKPQGEDEEAEGVDYEAQRQRNIQRNQQLLMELGLNTIPIHREFPTTGKPSRLFKEKSFDDDDYVEGGEYVGGVRRKRTWRATPTVQVTQTRASKRIRGEPALEHNVDIEAIENGLKPDNDEEGREAPDSVPSEDPGSESKAIRWKGRKQTTGYVVEVEVADAGVPLTLGSIGTTIWDMGKIYKGKENRLKYWSGKGSLFRHPYPIGYRAEKHHFRERYMMHIKEGPHGPIFVVESSTGKVFEGSSPTLPWTKACLASYSKGTRISGPLFFGFSDPITQKMIEELDGYQTWEAVAAEVEEEEQAKLAAAEAAELEAAGSDSESKS
ncbi:MAG: hypothetical protein J3Q66DRAFT_312261 [Benniella sp.]|nr:MAG: hypothetical protein J3Q66DRAFT_312261 [Benniella sp.]